VFLFSFVFLACSVKQPSLTIINKSVNELENLIISLSPKVSKQEAFSLSRTSIAYTFQLSRQYAAISSPWIQNTLVNIGIKQRGLCHEWTEDLLKYLVKKNYKTLEFYAVGANVGYLNEHNALSVSAKGDSIENSILLDAWRNSGDLYFKKIREDNKYNWKERRGLYGILPQ
jgi:hypothetical protein